MLPQDVVAEFSVPPLLLVLAAYGYVCCRLSRPTASDEYTLMMSAFWNVSINMLMRTALHTHLCSRTREGHRALVCDLMIHIS